MRKLGKILVVLTVASLLGFTFLSSTRGYWLSPFSSSTVIKASHSDCPPYQRDANGNCPPHVYRNRLYRSHVGGGFLFGK